MKKIDQDWNKISNKYALHDHDFTKSPFHISSKELKEATNKSEPRLLCYHNSREDRPVIFKEMGLFILPVRNGHYVVLKGEGFVDLPPISEEPEVYKANLEFPLETLLTGDSEMQPLDYAFASNLIRHFLGEKKLYLTIRGRKRTPEFAFHAGGHELFVKGVQTEIDGGYESRTQIVLVEAKNDGKDNMNIRQMFYPYRHWTSVSKKPVKVVFFERINNNYSFWQYVFLDPLEFNSIHLVKSANYNIVED